MELRLAQEIAIIEQDNLFMVFIDLRKAYDTVNCDRLLITLDGYSAGPQLSVIFENFWGYQQVVPR